MQNLGGKWNTAFLEILTIAFISAVKQGKIGPLNRHGCKCNRR
jgi:hypothetical protein